MRLLNVPDEHGCLPRPRDLFDFHHLWRQQDYTIDCDWFESAAAKIAPSNERFGFPQPGKEPPWNPSNAPI
jgi:hypothetical protein